MATPTKRSSDDYYYHNTLELLRRYRDISFSQKLNKADLRSRIYCLYGSVVDENLQEVTDTGLDLHGTKIESHARAMVRTQNMLAILDEAVDLMRQNHRKGELYYWVLYYTFLSPQELETQEAILDALAQKMPRISKRSYYTYRCEAVDVLSSVLWGYTCRACEEALELLEEGL